MSLTDHHCHLLPAIDDGAASLEESLLMARLLVDAGFSQVYCTPHCIPGCFDTTARQVEKAVNALQKELAAAGIDLELQPGMEYYLDEHFPEQLEAPRPLGETGLLLVEAPSQAPPELIMENIVQIQRKGLTPLFAHPERCGWLAAPDPENGLWAKAKGIFTQNSESGTQNPSHLFDLRTMGCLFQANLGSFAGFYGSRVRTLARELKIAGSYHCYGSDGHGTAQLERVLQTDELTEIKIHHNPDPKGKPK